MLYGSRVKELCKERGISVAKLERMAGIPEKSISKWDKNVPSADKIQRIIEVLQISYSEFFNIGLTKTQKINSALEQLKRADKETYEDIIQKMRGQVIVSEITFNERALLDDFKKLNNEGQEIALHLVSGLLDFGYLWNRPKSKNEENQ